MNKCKRLHIDKCIIQCYDNKNKCDVLTFMQKIEKVVD